MTNVSTNVSPGPVARPAPAEVTAIDTQARGPLLLLAGSAVVWLVVSGIFALIASIQLHSPGFLADCFVLTHGRVDAMRETTFVYGWLANAGLAVGLWILGRLGGYPLRALNWATAGAIFWNIGVAGGIVGIAAGEMTSFSLLQLPGPIQPLMVAAYGSIAISGVLAWSGRRAERTYASQWYVVAALFLFPWVLTAAQIMLIWSPARGVVQSIAATWFAQCAWSLWLAPLALASAYYIVPKVGGRTLASYEFAPLGFWVLIFVGGWTGGRHLTLGPVPAWIGTMGVVACALLLFHYMIVALNLRVVRGARGTSVGFIKLGLFAYVLGGLVDALTSFRGVALQTQFTLFQTAQEQLALYAAASMMLFGGLYYMVPRLTGRPWASAALTMGHRALVTFGVVVLVIVLAVGGWTQGADLNNSKMALEDIFAGMRLSLLIVTAAHLVIFAANVLLLVNFFRTLGASVLQRAPVESPFRQPSAVEVSAS